MTKTKVIRKNSKFRNDVEKMVNSKSVRNMEDYVRTHGQVRSGLTSSSDGGALVPTEIVNTAKDLSAGKFQLKPYLNYVPIEESKSNYPVTNPSAVAYTKEELDKYQDLDDGVTVVPVDAKSYGGKITLSDELLNDSSISLTPMLAKNMATIMTNTQNKVISDKLTELEPKHVSSFNDILDAVTESVDGRFLKNVFVGQGALAKLRTMTDNNGRYLMDSNDNTIAGVPVVTLPNSLGHPNDIFVGDLGSALAYFDRGNTNLTYANNNLFAKSLAMVMRFDIEFTYKPAIARLTFDDVKPATK